jgi:hypothetical protein
VQYRRLGREDSHGRSKRNQVIPGDTEVTTENVIGVGMEDLSDKDRDDLEWGLQRELEEVMAER